MTKQAIREGFEKLRPGDQLQPLEAAARSRSEADWLVGMNATRAATIRGRAWVGGVVSLGRVQTPTLALIVKREREIQAFVPEPYWLVHGSSTRATRASGSKATRRGSSGDLKRAEEIVAKVSGKDGTVESVERKEQSERAPLLYDLTSLQRDANRRFGFSARRTLQAAQSLYEGKKAITYPRTSSRCLSGDLVPQLKPTAATLQPIARVPQAAPRTCSGSTSCRSRASSTTRRSATTTRSSRPTSSTTSGVLARRAAHLRPGRPALPGRLPPAGALCPHDGRHARRGGALPHARQDHARGRLARRLRRSRPTRSGSGGRGRRRSGRAPRRSRRARRSRASRPRSRPRRRSRRRATPRRRCSRRWRPRASSSTTRSCARR